MLLSKYSKSFILLFFTILMYVFNIKIYINNKNTSTENELPTFSHNVDNVSYEIPQPQNFEKAVVKRVIDGDTVELSDGQVVRYIGIDSPELKGNDCFSNEATRFNKILTEGKEVLLENDKSNTDRYKRLLRYVWVDNIFVNEYLVRNGFAYQKSYPPDIKYQQVLKQAQLNAKDNMKGIWASCPVKE